MSQIGVHAISKIHRRGTLGQLDDGRVRRQHVDAVFEKALSGFAGQVALPGQQLAQHRYLGVVLTAGRDTGIPLGAGLLVGPVCGNTMLGMVVHRLGADLDLDRLRRDIAHDGVQRLVAVGLGPRYIVVELVGYRRKAAVHQAQGLVTVGHRGDDDAQGTDVVDLPETERFATHLLDDAVDVLGAPLHCGRDTLDRQCRMQLGA